MRWADKEPSTTTAWLARCCSSAMTEDKTALLHLLTSPVSNIIGATCTRASALLLLRSAGLRTVAAGCSSACARKTLCGSSQRACSSGFASGGFIAPASQTMGPKLRARTIERTSGSYPELLVWPHSGRLQGSLTEELRQLLDTL